MSNKTQLATNNTKLASLIQELANKAAGGGSGGVETCSVRLYNTDGGVALMAYTYIAVNDAGELVPTLVTLNDWYNYGTFDITLENVLCGSGVDMIAHANIDLWYDAENADLYASFGTMDFWGFKIQAPSGGTAAIKLTDD